MGRALKALRQRLASYLPVALATLTSRSLVART